MPNGMAPFRPGVDDRIDEGESSGDSSRSSSPRSSGSLSPHISPHLTPTPAPGRHPAHTGPRLIYEPTENKQHEETSGDDADTDDEREGAPGSSPPQIRAPLGAPLGRLSPPAFPPADIQTEDWDELAEPPGADLQTQSQPPASPPADSDDADHHAHTAAASSEDARASPIDIEPDDPEVAHQDFFVPDFQRLLQNTTMVTYHQDISFQMVKYRWELQIYPRRVADAQDHPCAPHVGAYLAYMGPAGRRSDIVPNSVPLCFRIVAFHSAVVAEAAAAAAAAQSPSADLAAVPDGALKSSDPRNKQLAVTTPISLRFKQDWGFPCLIPHEELVSYLQPNGSLRIRILMQTERQIKRGSRLRPLADFLRDSSAPASTRATAWPYVGLNNQGATWSVDEHPTR